MTIKRKVVKHGQSINLGSFRIEFVKTNHSIVEHLPWRFSHRQASLSTQAISRSTILLYSAMPSDLQRFAEIGKKGVLALMCDSTNANRPGFTMSERTVGKTFDAIFSRASEQPDYRGNLRFQCGPCAADYQLCL